jgi:hypothetical protein
MHRHSPSPNIKHRRGKYACTKLCTCQLCGYCWYLPIQHRAQNCEFYQQLKGLEDGLNALDEDQPPSKYVRLDVRSPYRYPNTQAQTLATISGPSNNQEPHTQHQAGRISPFPTPSRTLDSFFTPRVPAECFWSSSGSEQGSPAKHGEASEITGAKAELELSLAKLDVHAPASPTSSLTNDDDEALPPHIIRIRRSDDERQPPPSCLTQANARGSQPTPSPPPHTEDQQVYVKTTGPKREPEEYIETIEPKIEPEIVPSCPASPTTQTPPQDMQTYLKSLERNRLSTSAVTMEMVLALPETHRGLEEAVARGTVAECDSQVSLLLRSCRLLGRPVCREIMLNIFCDH